MTLSTLAPITSPVPAPGTGCCTAGIIILLVAEGGAAKTGGGGGSFGTGGRVLLKKPGDVVAPCWEANS